MEEIAHALKLIESGEIEQGLLELEKQEKTDDANVKYLLVETYYNLGHLEKAQVLLDELLQLYPDEGDLYTLAAEILIELNEEDQAIEMLSDVQENDPSYVRAQLLLADLYQLQGLDEVAEQKLLKASTLIPDEPILFLGLGEFYLERGDYQKSIPFFKKALHANISTDDIDINVELRLAEAFSGSGEFEEALSYYQKGAKENIDVHDRFNYGYTAYQVGEYETAVEQFTKVKKIDPHFTSLYPYLAKSFESLQMLREAMETLTEGMSVDEYNDELYVHAGKLAFKLEDKEKGETYLRTVLARNPSHFEAVRTLAAFLQGEERYEEILELIDYAKDVGEEDPLLFWYGGVAANQLEEDEKAHQYFQYAYATFKEDADFLSEYGQFLLQVGKRKKAIQLLKQAVEIDSTLSDVKELLDVLENDEW